MKRNLVKLLDTSGNNESFALRISMPTKDYGDKPITSKEQLELVSLRNNNTKNTKRVGKIVKK